jgi:hypothetical protein
MNLHILKYLHIQDGNHRVQALKDLLQLPNLDRPKFMRNLEEYSVPTAIYSEAMPDDLAMRYGRLMNELQSMVSTANFIDDARFVANVKATMPAVPLPMHHSSTHTRVHVHFHVL